MTKSLRSLLLVTAALLAPQFASATILVGIHDFDGDNNPDNQEPASLASEAADITNLGFSGRILKNGAGSVGGGGSNDGTFGSLATPAGLNDGYLRSTGSTNPIFEVTAPANHTGGPGILAFDAAKQTSPNGVVGLSWRYGTAGDWIAIAPTSIKPNNVTESPFAGGAGTNANYKDFWVNLNTIGLQFDGTNQTIQFLFDLDPNGRLDNVALVPEPGSLLALGCLMGGGAFFRSRRRRA